MEANEIINRVRGIMKARHITQADAAQLLGVTQNTISLYLSGRPRLDTFLKLCAALQIDPAEVLKDEASQDQTQQARIFCPHCKKPLTIQIATAAEPDTTNTTK